MTTPAVVCVGLATLDHIAAAPRNPGPDELVLASAFAVAGGGPAATAAVTLARLGVATAFVGAVGDDEVGAAIVDGLEQEGVDASEVSIVPGARSPQSVVVVSPAGRSITAFRGALPPIEPSDEAVEMMLSAAWVHVDQTGYGAVSRSVRLSIDGGNPIDGLDVGGVSLYAPTEHQLRERFGSAEAALQAGARLVVVTRGDRGSAAYTRDGEVVEVAAHEVEVVSTLGAGDVFHGALLAELVREAPLADALAFANRCAALSCRALDGRSAIPTLLELAT